MRVGDYCKHDVVTVDADSDIKHDGALTGIPAMDDVLEVLTGMLCDVSGTVRNEQRQERRLLVDAP